MNQHAHLDQTDSIAAIADQLAELAEGLRCGMQSRSVAIPIPQTPTARKAAFLKIAKRTYANRRRRDGILGNPALLGEPAWDILLDLYIAQAEGHSVSVSSACIGSAAPATTGLRWLGVLQEEGLVQRVNDPEDQRRVLVLLSPEGIKCMERYYCEVEGLVDMQAVAFSDASHGAPHPGPAQIASPFAATSA